MNSRWYSPIPVAALLVLAAGPPPQGQAPALPPAAWRGLIGEYGPDSARTISPKASIAGRVPAQKTVMTTAPPSALPVPPAVATKAYSQPHGRSAEAMPRRAARPA